MHGALRRTVLCCDVTVFCSSRNRVEKASEMWNRLNGVAGNFRTNLRQFATEVMQDMEEEPSEEDSPSFPKQVPHSYNSVPPVPRHSAPDKANSF